jgi:hypothetical protein
VCWQPRPPLVTWSGPHRPARRGARFRSLRRLAIGSVGLRWCRKLGLHLLREHARGPIDDHAAYGIGLRRRTNRWNCRFALAFKAYVALPLPGLPAPLRSDVRCAGRGLALWPGLQMGLGLLPHRNRVHFAPAQRGLPRYIESCFEIRELFYCTSCGLVTPFFSCKANG